MIFSLSIFSRKFWREISKRGLLVDEQHRFLAGFLPWLYLMVLTLQIVGWVNVLEDGLPTFVLVLFLAFSVFTVSRAYYWWARREAFKTYTQAQKFRDIIAVYIAAPLFGLFFSSVYAYLVFTTGDLNQVFIGISIVALSIAGSFSLYVVPVAAWGLLLGTIVPMASVFVLSNDNRLVTLGAVFFGIMFFSQFLIAQNYINFSALVRSRCQLVKEKIASQRTANSVERLAFYDALTDLPNRRNFVRSLIGFQEKTDIGAKGFAVGVLDIAGFKSIDEVYGRDAGDGLLRQVASRLSDLNEKYYKGTGVIARLGGDEFVFLAPEIENAEDASHLGSVLCQSLSPEFDVEGGKVVLSFSCGVALYPYSDSDPDRLIARADMARRKSAKVNSNTIGVFSLSMELDRLRRSRVEYALKRAVENDLIEPWFQPIVRISDGSIAGFESLARWHDKSLGHVGPDEFIQIAEESQLIEELTLNMFKRSLEVAKTWSPETKLFFNLSAKVLTRQNSVDKMLEILVQSGVPASRIDIELTETAIMQDLELAKQKMLKLKEAGVGIALDDFGSGYSSLGQIRDLPLDKVKIDKSFTDQICTDDKIRNIVQAIIQLCNQLDISCVVEGIEDLEQVGLLADMGCEFGQGYLFSKPIMAEKTARRVLLTNAA